MQDIADAADVSRITVSRVLNHTGSINEKTRKRIFKLAEEMNYFRNVNATSLANNKTNTIAAVFSHFSEYLFNIDYNMHLLGGIQNQCIKKNYHLLIPSINQKNTANKYSLPYYERRVDGIIVIAPNSGEKEVIKMAQEGIPTVVISSKYDDPPVNYIDVDNERGIFNAIQYLVELGHTEIGLINGPLNQTDAVCRQNGFMHALNHFQLPVNQNWILNGDFMVEDGYKNALQLFKLAHKPTALMCGNDYIAIGVKKACDELGIIIPNDLSIIGFDDVVNTDFFPLTTLKQPLVDMGKSAVKILIDCINDDDNGMIKKIFVPELIIRNSCRKI